MSIHDEKEAPIQDSSRALTDSDIVTERRFSRRSFVAATGALLAGGAMAVLTEGRAMALQTAPQTDPDSKKASDPDSKKASDPDKKKHHHHKKGSDPDKKKGAANASDPDSNKGTPKSSDPDSSQR